MIDLNKIRFGNQKLKNEAVTELYETSIQYCIGRLCRRGADMATAEDAFHEGILAFIDKVVKSPLFVLSVDAKVYLYRICLNKYIDQFRKQKRMPMISIIDEEIQEILDESLGEVERKLIIERLMIVFEEKLKKECQVILKAFYFHQKSLKEIAEMQNITPNSAKTQKSRCLRYLRDMIVDLGQINRAV